jgi:hypothetical protein
MIMTFILVKDNTIECHAHLTLEFTLKLFIELHEQAGGVEVLYLG